jgi:hypothetical protein
MVDILGIQSIASHCPYHRLDHGRPRRDSSCHIFNFGGPFTIDDTAVWNKDKLGFNRYANILVVSYSYGVGNSGIINDKWKKIKFKNMPHNFVRFLQRWWDNHPNTKKTTSISAATQPWANYSRRCTTTLSYPSQHSSHE